MDNNINLSHQKELEEFKTRIAAVKREHHKDCDLDKWLKARRYNVDEAEKMYKQSMMWRKAYKADSILETYEMPEVLKKYYPGGLCGQDKEGRPIFFDWLGHMDMKGLLKSCSQDEIVKCAVYRMENCYKVFAEQTERTGRRVNQVCQVIDVQGFGRKHVYLPGAELIIEILKVLDNNYPETLYRTYLINAPTLFSFGYNTVIKPFLSEDTRNKFEFLGSNWKTELRERLGTDQYPEYWGGILKDPDGDIYCQSKICIGGDVPEEYYNESINQDIDNQNFKSVTVKHGECHCENIHIKSKSTVINYNFFTKSYSINFEVVYLKNENCDSNAAAVLEEKRSVNCHKIPEKGNVFCDHPGVYQFRFDNTSSWFNDKKLTYKIEEMNEGEELKKLEENYANESVVEKL